MIRAIVLDKATFAGSSVIIDHMCTAKDVDGSKIRTESLMAAPKTNMSAADSPMIRPIPKNVAVKMPGTACGKTTLKVVCVLFAPSANDAKR